jgi:hypothetical protein
MAVARANGIEAKLVKAFGVAADEFDFIDIRRRLPVAQG